MTIFGKETVTSLPTQCLALKVPSETLQNVSPLIKLDPLVSPLITLPAWDTEGGSQRDRHLLLFYYFSYLYLIQLR